MKDNVVTTLKHIREGSINPKDIPARQRQLCVAYLRLEGYTQIEISEIFKVNRITIIRDEKIIRKGYKKLIDELDVKAIAGELIATASQLISKAVRKEDYGLAWRIRSELITKLQSLGFLPKAAEQVNIHMNSFVDLMRFAENLESEEIPDTKRIESSIIEEKTENHEQ